MTIQLYPYQQEMVGRIYEAWGQGHRNVMIMMGTGTGKTVTFSSIVRDYNVMTVVLAHRSELVGQISLALAKYGVRHRIIAARDTVRAIVASHMLELQRDYTDPRARVAVVSVDTFVLLDPAKNPWLKEVGLFVPDEAHHVLKENKWGKAAAMVPNAWGLMPTATPGRSDGKGLGRSSHGIADILLKGPTMRDLINWGYRMPYRVVAPPNCVDVSHIKVSATTGDFNPIELRDEVHKNRQLVGDVVAQYLKFAGGMIGATFAVDVEEAGKLADAYRHAGVPAEVITGKTPTDIRTRVMRKLRAGEIKQIVSVDILGEGTDVPALEVVSMARPTASFIVYSQQFGRARGIGKNAIVIDHVGNVVRHGLPDAPREWSLEPRERKSRGTGPNDAIPMTSCLNPECLAAYERIYPSCPFCGYHNPPSARSTLEQVDGDLVELDPSVLATMLGEVNRIDGAFRPPINVPPAAQRAAYLHHQARQAAQRGLRHAMSIWMGWQKALGRGDREIQRLFFFRFGIDVLSAQALNAKDAEGLLAVVAGDLVANNVREG